MWRVHVVMTCGISPHPSIWVCMRGMCMCVHAVCDTYGDDIDAEALLWFLKLRQEVGYAVTAIDEVKACLHASLPERENANMSERMMRHT